MCVWSYRSSRGNSLFALVPHGWIWLKLLPRDRPWYDVTGTSQLAQSKFNVIPNEHTVKLHGLVKVMFRSFRTFLPNRNTFCEVKFVLSNAYLPARLAGLFPNITCRRFWKLYLKDLLSAVRNFPFPSVKAQNKISFT